MEKGKRTITEWLNCLPVDIAERALSQRTSPDVYCDTLVDALCVFADWPATKEGNEYWEGIYDRLVAGEIAVREEDDDDYWDACARLRAEKELAKKINGLPIVDSCPPKLEEIFMLRDRFAMAALSGLISSEVYENHSSVQWARLSYDIADDMMIERERRMKNG